MARLSHSVEAQLRIVCHQEHDTVGINSGDLETLSTGRKPAHPLNGDQNRVTKTLHFSEKRRATSAGRGEGAHDRRIRKEVARPKVQRDDVQ